MRKLSWKVQLRGGGLCKVKQVGYLNFSNMTFLPSGQGRHLCRKPYENLGFLDALRLCHKLAAYLDKIGECHK